MPPSPPTNHPEIQSRSLRKAPLWPTTINPHQPPCFEHLGSAVATLLSTATSPTTSPYLSIKNKYRRKGLENPCGGYSHKQTSFIIQSTFDFVECVEEAIRSDGGTKEQHAKRVPSEHVPPRGIGSFDAEFSGFAPQLFGNTRHPNKRVDEHRRNAQHVRHPIALRLVPEYFVYLILQAQRHVDEKEQSCRTEVNQTEQKSRSIGVIVSQNQCVALRCCKSPYQ